MITEELFRLVNVTTFRMGPTARYFSVVNSLVELKESFVFAEKNNIPTLILGGGSNTVFNDESTLEVSVLKIDIKGFRVIKDSAEEVLVEVGAGEIWDEVVKRTVELGLSGLEALSAIPGTAGATPIQNVGAYGVETSDVLVSLQAYEIATGNVREFKNIDCNFKYRDSIFKNELKGKYVITSVTFKLSKKPAPIPNYTGVKDYFLERKINNPTIFQIREAIIEIRQKKLPDPKAIASVGSFFKNPIVSNAKYLELKSRYPNLVAFPFDNDQFKIGAGWMLEELGFKGKDFDHLQIYPDNALVIVNKGCASFVELKTVVEQIRERVRNTFNIELEIEPEIINGQL